MTRVEQKNMIHDLRQYQRKMSGKEIADFEMMLKREKDDEDLDELTRRRLVELHERYVPRRSKKDLDDLWERLKSGKK
jgi:hypothetical protein